MVSSSPGSNSGWLLRTTWNCVPPPTRVNIVNGLVCVSWLLSRLILSAAVAMPAWLS